MSENNFFDLFSGYPYESGFNFENLLDLAKRFADDGFYFEDTVPISELPWIRVQILCEEVL